MAIISFDRDALIDYVPEYAGNREHTDPCIVRMRFVPFSRVQHYSRLIAGRTRGVDDQARIAEITHDVQRRQFTDSVESVENYSVGDRVVTDPGEFYDTADTELIVEVIRAMESQNRLSEGQRKNF